MKTYLSKLGVSALTLLSLSTSAFSAPTLYTPKEHESLLPKCVANLNLQAAVHKKNVVKLTWNPFAVESNNVLKLYRKDQNGRLRTFSPTHHLHYHDRHVKPGHTYTYKLIATEAGTEITTSKTTIKVSTKPKKQLHLTAAVQEQSTNSNVRLIWNPNFSVKAKKFKLYRNDEHIKTVDASHRLRFTDVGQPKDTNLTYKLVALGSHGKKIKTSVLAVNTNSCSDTPCTPPGSIAIPDQFFGIGEAVDFNTSVFFSSTLPLTYEISAAPKGLDFDTSTGILSGVPSLAGVFPVTVTATSSCGSATQPFTITIQNL